MQLTTREITAAREWLDDVLAYPPFTSAELVTRAVERFYEGGIPGFKADFAAFAAGGL